MPDPIHDNPMVAHAAARLVDHVEDIVSSRQARKHRDLRRQYGKASATIHVLRGDLAQAKIDLDDMTARWRKQSLDLAALLNAVLGEDFTDAEQLDHAIDEARRMRENDTAGRVRRDFGPDGRLAPAVQTRHGIEYHYEDDPHDGRRAGWYPPNRSRCLTFEEVAAQLGPLEFCPRPTVFTSRGYAMYFEEEEDQ